MKILFIAPLPPPITGHSLASEVLLNELKKNHSVEIINFSKQTLKQGISSFKRIIEIIRMLREIRIKNKDADVIYLTISQSIAGNIKDILTYFICFEKLPSMVIHLHGGGLKKWIFDRFKMLYYVNKYFLKRVGGIVVLGKSLVHIFQDIIPSEKIYIVPNFAEDHLFLTKNEIEKKYEDKGILRVLFLSNLLPGKGHEELLEGYKALNENLQKKIQIDFAGEFESENQKDAFLKKIDGITNIHYHGVVTGEHKKELFSRAHIFCLPTYYYYEGQPISILEAYATGCAVITTDHGGISDIFEDKVNGFLVQKQSYLSIKEVIENIIEHPEKLREIGLYNRMVAEKIYNKERYCSDLVKIIETIIQRK